MKVNSVTIREASNGFVVEHLSESEYDKFLSEFIALDVDEALAIARDLFVHYDAADMSHLVDTPIGR
jgi:TnpA family transposase